MGKARVAEVAAAWGIPPERLEREAVEVWLERRLALIEAEIAEILARYGVQSLGELESGIRSGRIPEHPAWEDLIVLERLIEEKKVISELLGS